VLQLIHFNPNLGQSTVDPKYNYQFENVENPVVDAPQWPQMTEAPPRAMLIPNLGYRNEVDSPG
jgi:hypothetical protein